MQVRGGVGCASTMSEMANVGGVGGAVSVCVCNRVCSCVWLMGCVKLYLYLCVLNGARVTVGAGV